ncbi:MAG TPA: response regulator [candidate division Zixibacteria bacterium]|nr:response regulator [candidate division Zixibacteria bacterium]
MGKKSILVVDDELLIRDLLYDFFSEKGWLVSVQESPDRGLEMMRNRNFDIALVDLKMPEIDGIELIRKIRNLRPALPIVIMTAFPSTETAIEALRLKVNDYIIKPFNINKLFRVLDAIIEESCRHEDVKEGRLKV